MIISTHIYIYINCVGWSSGVSIFCFCFFLGSAWNTFALMPDSKVYESSQHQSISPLSPEYDLFKSCHTLEMTINGPDFAQKTALTNRCSQWQQVRPVPTIAVGVGTSIVWIQVVEVTTTPNLRVATAVEGPCSRVFRWAGICGVWCASACWTETV